MSDRLHIEGEWPDVITIRQGWARALARPWNDDSANAAVRLTRGGATFLRRATGVVDQLATGDVFSPALYPSVSAVWRRAGYATHLELEILERSLWQRPDQPEHPVGTADRDDLELLLAVDRAAFDGFWRMSADGLADAMEATSKSAALTVHHGGGLAGYALVGAQFSVSFLQRIAVVPEHGGSGLGSSLLRASLHWARRRRSRTMILNVREDNSTARRLYRREGFAPTGATLELLRYER